MTEALKVNKADLPPNGLVMQIIREREALSGVVAGPFEAEDMTSDPINKVTIYTIDGQKYVHKQLGDGSSIASEKIGKQLALGAGLPVPEIIFANDTETVERFLEGSPVNPNTMSDREIRDLCHELGNMLKKLHSVKVDGYGLFRSENVNEFDNIKDYFTRLKERSMERAKNSGQFSDAQITKIQESFDASIANPGEHDPVLTHQDIGHTDLQNILVKDGKITGIIDFAQCQGSVPESDFARLYIQQRLQPDKPPYFDYTKESYGELDISQLRIFVVFALVRLIAGDSLKFGGAEKMKSLLDEILDIQ